MKNNKFFIALALCVAMQPAVSFCAEEPQSKSYWQQYAPEFMQKGTRYVSEQATNMYNTVSNWSTRKQIAVLGAILTVLVGVYYRDQIMQFISTVGEGQVSKAKIFADYVAAMESGNTSAALSLKKQAHELGISDSELAAAHKLYVK
jgi:hypothetical protein